MKAMKKRWTVWLGLRNGGFAIAILVTGILVAAMAAKSGSQQQRQLSPLGYGYRPDLLLPRWDSKLSITKNKGSSRSLNSHVVGPPPPSLFPLLQTRRSRQENLGWSLIWATSTPGSIILPDGKDNLFLIGERVYKIDSKSGSIIWSSPLPSSANDACLTPQGDLCVIGTIYLGFAGTDWVVTKYNKETGSIIWQQGYGARAWDSWDYPSSLTVDQNGDIYVIGYVEEKSGSGFFATIRRYMGIVKYNGITGEIVWDSWNSQDGRGWYACGTDIVYNNGYIYALGYDGSGWGIYSPIEIVLLSKYDASTGTLLWNRTYSYGFRTPGGQIRIGQDGNLVLAGTLYAESYTEGKYPYGFFVLKVTSSNGDPIWSHSEYKYKMLLKAVDLDALDSIYLALHSGGDYVVKKLSNTGELVWQTVYNGSGNSFDEPNSLAISNRYVIVTGKSMGQSNNYDYATIVINKENGTIENILLFDEGSDEEAKNVIFFKMPFMFQGIQNY